jgi:lipopolysaccharide transport system permease protein
MTTLTTDTSDAPATPAADRAAPPPGRPASARTVIEPAGGWELVDVRELWRYRELLAALARRDVAVRYKQTALGAAWAVLQPAMMMVVFTVFFGRLAGLPSGEVPYPLFVLTGLLPWMLFTQAVSSAANSVVGSERLITKIYFPRLAVPFAAVAAAAVDFLVACGLLAVVAGGYAVFTDFRPALSGQVLLVPVVFALIALLAAGLGTLLAALNVMYRDVRYVVPFLLQVGMFATPTIYLQPTGQPGRLMTALIAANPMASLVSAFRAGVLGGPVPWAGLAVAVAAGVLLFVAGCLYFRKVEDRFADII